jgi:hypothetical protein
VQAGNGGGAHGAASLDIAGVMDATDPAAVAKLPAAQGGGGGLLRRQFSEDQAPRPAGGGVAGRVGAVGLHPVLARDADRLVIVDHRTGAIVLALGGVGAAAGVDDDAVEQLRQDRRALQGDALADGAGEALLGRRAEQVDVGLGLGPARRALQRTAGFEGRLVGRFGSRV